MVITACAQSQVSVVNISRDSACCSFLGKMIKQALPCVAPESSYSAGEITATPAAQVVRLLRPHVFARSQLAVGHVSH